MATVEISDEIFDEISVRVKKTKFESEEDYIIHVLQELLSHLEESSTEDPSQQVDKDEVERRLKSLGYLDN